MHVEIFRDLRGRWPWRLTDETLKVEEAHRSYSELEDCAAEVDRVRATNALTPAVIATRI